MSVTQRRDGRRIVREVTIDLDNLAADVADARAQGEPWKVLEDMTGYTRQYLDKVLQEAEAAAAAPQTGLVVKSVRLQFRKLPNEPPSLNVARQLVRKR